MLVGLLHAPTIARFRCPGDVTVCVVPNLTRFRFRKLNLRSVSGIDNEP
jgi:hypothetical protein